jgi:hypothetical protein
MSDFQFIHFPNFVYKIEANEETRSHFLLFFVLFWWDWDLNLGALPLQSRCSTT